MTLIYELNYDPNKGYRTKIFENNGGTERLFGSFSTDSPNAFYGIVRSALENSRSEVTVRSYNLDAKVCEEFSRFEQGVRDIQQKRIFGLKL